MRKYSKISYQLITIFLIVVVGIQSLNSFFNTHCHQLADGTIIVHAHPYEQESDSNPIKTHAHSNAELVFLANLIYFLPVLPLLVLGSFFNLQRTLADFSLSILSQFNFDIPNLRGPPLKFVV